MSNTHTRRAAMAVASSFALLALAACGGSDEAETKTESKPSPVSTPAATDDAPAEAPADAATGATPAWAKPASQAGEKIASFKAGDISVDVFQVGVTKATKTGQFVDPDTSKPIIAEGDDIVFVNFVATNNGAPIDLGSSLVNVTARYDDWKYLQGMDSIVDSALFEQMKVDADVLGPDGYNEKGIYTLGSGQTISVAENFRYQKGSPITFEAEVVPVDAEGELLHDKKIEGEGKAKIK